MNIDMRSRMCNAGYSLHARHASYDVFGIDPRHPHVPPLNHNLRRRCGFSFRGRLGFPRCVDQASFSRGRKLGCADLQLLLLAEGPSHGHELIKALDDRSKGYYVPSPDMGYPARTYLEEIGAKKRYSVTESGLSHLESNCLEVEAVFTQLDWIEPEDRTRGAPCRAQSKARAAVTTQRQ